MRFERVGCFTYSHEENTHAFKLEDDVPEDVKTQAGRGHHGTASGDIL
jgi:tRNA A37 methylthiotransferase MiaB